MGTNNLPTAVSGTPIPPSHHNAIKTAMGVDIVPRNVSGVPTDVSGSIGSSTFSWLKVFFGIKTAGISLSESGGDMIVNVGGSAVTTIKSTGIVLNSIGPRAKTTDGSDPGVFGFCRSAVTVDTTLTSPGPADAVIPGSTMSLSISGNGNPVRVSITGQINCRGNANQNPGGELSLFRDTQASYATETRLQAFPFSWAGLNGVPVTNAGYTVSDTFEFFDDTVSASTTYFYRWKLQDNTGRLNASSGDESFLYVVLLDTSHARCYEII